MLRTLFASDDALSVPEELPITLHINGYAIATVQGTRSELFDWTCGFLFGEGLIQSPAQVCDFVVTEGGARLWVRLPHIGEQEAAQLPYRYLNGWAACPMQASDVPPVPTTPTMPAAAAPTVPHARLATFQARMHAAAALYQATGGTHVAGLFRATDGAMLIREDIGRHNAVDKVIGAALQAGWEPADLVLTLSGRISAAICSKALRFGVRLLASRSAATDQAVQLGQAAGATLIGYLRPHSMRVYTKQGVMPRESDQA